MAQAHATPTIARAPFYRRQWFKRLIVAVVAVLVFVAVALFVTFLSWWLSPDRALLDIAQYAVRTPGTYRVESSGTDITVTTRDDEYALSGTLEGVPMNAVLDGGTLYLKSSQPDQMYEFFMGGGKNQQIPGVVQTILPTIVNKWIAVDLNNIPLNSRFAQTTQCLFQERGSIADDPNARREWGGTYLAHRFLKVTSSEQPSTTVYSVAINKSQRTAFFASLQKTSFYSSLTDCSEDTDVLGNFKDDSLAATVVVSRTDHIPQSMTITPHGRDPVKVTADYANVPQIAIPSDAISIDQLLLGMLGSLGGL